MQTGGASTLIPRLAFDGLPTNTKLNFQPDAAVDGCFPATLIAVGKQKQWGLATTNNNWNSQISFAVAFTSACYAITTIPYAIGGVIAGGGIYRDYGGINSVDKNGFYGGYGKAGINFFYIAAGR